LETMVPVKGAALISGSSITTSDCLTCLFSGRLSSPEFVRISVFPEENIGGGNTGWYWLTSPTPGGGTTVLARSSEDFWTKSTWGSHPLKSTVVVTVSISHATSDWLTTVLPDSIWFDRGENSFWGGTGSSESTWNNSFCNNWLGAHDNLSSESLLDTPWFSSWKTGSPSWVGKILLVSTVDGLVLVGSLTTEEIVIDGTTSRSR